MAYLFRGGVPRAPTTVEYYESLDNLVRRTCDGIEHLRTDEGPDWRSEEMKAATRDRGTRHTHSLVDGHGQNRVERLFRTLQERAAAAVLQAGFDNRYLFYAMEAVNFIQNHVVRNGTSRYVATHGPDP